MPRFARRVSKLAVQASKVVDDEQGQADRGDMSQRPPSRMSGSSQDCPSPSEKPDTESTSTKVPSIADHTSIDSHNNYLHSWNAKSNIYQNYLDSGDTIGVTESELPGFDIPSAFLYCSPELEPSLDQSQLYTPPMSLDDSQDGLQYLQTLLDISSPAPLGPPPSSLETEPTALCSYSPVWNLKTPMKTREISDTISSISHSTVPRLESHHILRAAEGSWPVANCLSRTSPCPQTSTIHLEGLEKSLQDESIWLLMEENLDDLDRLGMHDDVQELPLAPFLVTPLNSRAREQLLALTQSFLKRALEVHRGAKQELTPTISNFVFIVLPPNKVLECFLRNCVRGLAQFYPLTTQETVDPNEILLDSNRGATLLVLLMIAHGAARLSTLEGQSLYAGLTELCRVTFCEALEKNHALSTDRVTLQCALLLCINCAWSGDKWMMDFALGRSATMLAVSVADQSMHEAR